MNDATLTPLNPTRQDRVRETGAIQTRIDAAAAKGGGRVIIPKGIHPCRTLYLKSGVELHLEEGAVILGGPKPEDYDDAIPVEMVYRYGDANTAPTVTRKALVFAENAENVAITGKGAIQIDGPAFFDHGTSFGGGPAWDKPPWPRPRMVVMLRCRHVRFEDATFKDCPLWTMWLRFCEDVAVSRIRIEAEQRMINSDGIDFDGCRHVRVADSSFKTGDDCVVLRAIRLGHPGEGTVVTEDVVVENCSLDTPCQGVRIGCPSDDTVRDAVFRDISFRGRNAIGSQQPRHYLNAGDNGYLRTANILFENWRIKGGCPLELFVGDGIALRDFGHMTFRNFTVETERPFVVKGNEATPVRGMRFESIRGAVKSGKAFDVEHAPDIVFGSMDVTARS